MIATLLTRKWPFAALLLGRRPVGRDEAEPAFGELTLVRRDFRDAEHEVELFACLVVFAASERQRAEAQASEAPVGSLGPGQRRESGGARLLFPRLVDPE